MGEKDYSGTPLWRKLGIAAGGRVSIRRGPEGFAATLETLAPLPDGVRFLTRPGDDMDVLIAFVRRREDLDDVLARLVPRLARSGRLWIAWPKKSSGLGTDLDFSTVQAAGLAAGLVDNKSASITDEHQGVQFVYRLRDR